MGMTLQPAPRHGAAGGGGRIPELDGFRAIAFLGVLLAHGFYGFPDPAGALESLPGALAFVISRGWLGVDLFFVLSGFLITGILLDSKDDPKFFKNFYGRRVLRIMPVYVAVVVVCSFFYQGYGPYFGLSLAMLANFAETLGIHVPHGPGVFWSLSVEEHFYLVWPLLVWFLPARGVAVVAFLVFVGSPALRGWAALSGVSTEQIYALSWYRFDGLALGALLALWRRGALWIPPRSGLLAGALIGISVAVTLLGLPFGILGTKTTAAVAFRYTQVQLVFAAAMVLALLYAGTSPTGLLTNRFMRITADYSYCMYMVHLSLGDAYVWTLALLGWHPEHYVGGLGAIVLRTLSMALLSYGVGAVSYRYLECPVLRLKVHFEPRFEPGDPAQRHVICEDPHARRRND